MDDAKCDPDDFEERLFRATASKRWEQAEELFRRWDKRTLSPASNRRLDLERYAFVALAIGRYPDRPPVWALKACADLYARDAVAHSSIFDRRSQTQFDELLENLALQLVSAEPNESGSLTRRRPKRGSINGAAKEVLKDRFGQTEIPEDDPTKQHLLALWRKQSARDRKARMERAVRRHMKERGFDSRWTKINSDSPIED